jgi:fatty-acyl-CoA synthase
MLDLILAERVTHYCGAPIVHQGLHDAAVRRSVRFDPPVNAMVAAAPPPAALFEGMERINVRMTHVYGLTEVYGPASICEHRKEWDALSLEDRAARHARQGVRYALEDGMTVMDPKTMQPVTADGETVGEIMFRGNIMMMGYLKDATASDEAFRGGWFHSGDLAVLDPDGYARILDRSKDIIISGGENISSVEVEGVLYAYPAIAAAAVVAMPHPRWGETPVAVIELRDGVAVTDEEIIAHCRAHLAHFKCPTRVVRWEIPKTSTGKIQKNVLRERVRRDLAG